MEACEVAAKVTFGVEVHVEGVKIDEIGLEILRGWIVGVGHQRQGVHRLRRFVQLLQEAPDL